MTIGRKPEILQQIKEGNPTVKGQSEPHRFYDVPHPQKKLWLVWDTGEMKFFYYSHLADGDLALDGDVNVLTLYFVAKILVLKGYNLSILFNHFIYDEPHLIAVVDHRYLDTVPLDEFVVTDAIIGK